MNKEALQALQERLIKQKEKAKQIEARIQAIEAREKARQKEQDRKNDTRRKILLGSFMSKKLQEGGQQTVTFEMSEFLEYLTEDRDKKLFEV